MLRSPIVFAHGPITLNEHLATDGTPDTTKVQDTFLVEERITDPAFRSTHEPYHLALGGGLGRSHKGFSYLQLRGRLLVPNATQLTRLADRERTFRAAFDPSICAADSPSTDGAYALDWYEPTADVGNFPTGLIHVAMYARPLQQPKLVERMAESQARPWSVALEASDPRVFSQALNSLALTPGSPTGNLVNLGSVPAPLRATIVMAGAGNAAFTITRGGVAYVLNLAGTANLDSIVVVFETSGPFGRGKLITKNGIESFSLKTSGPNTWLTAPAGTTAVTITNTGNVTSCTLAYPHAWA